MGQTTGTVMGHEKPATVTISIVQGSIVVNPQTAITLSKQAGDRVTWQRAGGGEFEIEFKNKTPFYSFRFNQNDAHGLKVRDTAPYDVYSYTVKVPGYPDLDPEVIVDP